MTSLVFKLDMVQTLALAAVILFVGYGVRRRVGVLDRYNIPAPVIGGFLFAAVALTLRLQGVVAFEFDTTLQTPLMIAFFTTIGLGASLALLKDRRAAGPAVLGAGERPRGHPERRRGAARQRRWVCIRSSA